MNSSAYIAAKFADYQVEIIDWPYSAPTTGMAREGGRLRIHVKVNRIPSLRIFRCRVYDGITAEERTSIERWCQALPRGAWADDGADVWHRKTLQGVVVFQGRFGKPINEQDEELELELLLLIEEFRTNDCWA